MSYKIKVKRTKMSNLTSVRQVERMRFKKKKQATDFKKEFVPKRGRVIKA